MANNRNNLISQENMYRTKR